MSANLSITETVGTSSDCSSILLVDMCHVVVGVSREVELAISSDFKFDADQLALRVTCRYDLQIAQPASTMLTVGVRP